MANKIGIIMYQYPLGVSTMIICTIEELLKRHDFVTVFIDEATYNLSPLNSFDDDTSFSKCIIKYKWSIKKKIYRKLSSFLVEHVLRIPPHTLNLFSAIFDLELGNFLSAISHKLDNTYTHVIGVEPLGMAIATSANNNRKKILYYNMELLQKSSCKSVKWRAIKEIELTCLSKVSTVVIQNEQRSNVFAGESKFPRDSIQLLPIFSSGDLITERTEYFRNKLSIPKAKTCVIYAGNIQAWSMCHELVESVSDWSNNFALIIHTWNRLCVASKYYKDMLIKANGLPIYFSTFPIEYQKLPHALASADIGIILYKSLDENFTEVAGSSNKLAEYLKACLPIVTLSNTSISVFVRSHDIGLTVDSIHEIPSALEYIRLNLNHFRSNCILCYKKFRFETLFQHMYEREFMVKQ